MILEKETEKKFGMCCSFYADQMNQSKANGGKKEYGIKIN
jgi:hypothetical protein